MSVFCFAKHFFFFFKWWLSKYYFFSFFVVVVKTRKSSASLHCLLPEITAVHSVLCLSVQLSASVKCADKRSSHKLHFFLRGLSSASLYEAIKRFRLVFRLVFVLPGVETTSGNNREKKKCCLSQSTLHSVSEPPCSDWKNKNTWFGLKMSFCIYVVITELRK